MKIVVAVAACCMLFGMAASTNGFQGMDIPELRRLAEQGNPEAQSKLGVLYASGIGTAKDSKEAVRWYEKSAAQGFPLGMWNLAFACLKGEGAAADPVRAFGLMRGAAEQGLDLAQFDLGMMYLQGIGTAADRTEAERWIRKSAAQGYREARKMLQEFETK